MVKMNKSIFKKIGCVLISASVILTGWTFFGTSTAVAEYDSGTYTTDGGTLEDLSTYQSELTAVTSTGDLSIGASALANYTALESIVVNGALSLGSSALMGDASLATLSCTTMSGADASTFQGCSNITIGISGQSEGSGYFTYGGALYNGTTLVYVPQTAGESITVYSGTTAISEGAFNDSIVTSLIFNNGDANNISSFGTQTGWPLDNTICYAYGSSNTSAEAVTNFFAQYGTDNVVYDSSDVDDTTTYTVTVTETASDGSFSETITYSNQAAGTVISPTTRSGYTCSDTYTVTTDANQTATFTYTASSDDSGGGGGSGAVTYTVSIVGNFYESDGTTYIGQNTLSSGSYAAGQVISAPTKDGYTAFGTTTYTVTATNGQTATFNYKKNASSSSSSKKKFTVTVYDVLYNADCSKKIETRTRKTDSYDEGATFSYAPISITGYEYFDAEGQSGTVNQNRTVTFKYKATSATSSSTTSSKYKVTQGANLKIGQSEGPVTIVCDGPMDKLTRVMMDGADIPEGRYTLQSGSVILTLTHGYIESLSVGDHTVRFEYTDGYAETTLTITGKTTTTVSYKVSSDGSISSGHTKDTTPKTADGFDNRYLLCLAIFLLGAGSILFSRQKKLEAILAGERDED